MGVGVASGISSLLKKGLGSLGSLTTAFGRSTKKPSNQKNVVFNIRSNGKVIYIYVERADRLDFEASKELTERIIEALNKEIEEERFQNPDIAFKALSPADRASSTDISTAIYNCYNLPAESGENELIYKLPSEEFSRITRKVIAYWAEEQKDCVITELSSVKFQRKVYRMSLPILDHG